MRTKWLNDWQRAAIVEAVSQSIDSGSLNRDSGQSLLKLVEAASHIRLSFNNDVDVPE